MNELNLKKTFLVGVVLSLTLSAFVGVIALLFGTFGEVEFKILFTTFAVGLFSLTSLVNSILLERKKYVALAVVGIVVSAFGFLSTEFVVWIVSLSSDIWKIPVISVILAIAIAHSSLILLNSQIPMVKTISNIALVFIATVALMLVYLVFSSYPYPSESFYRILGAIAILDVLLTIVIPVLNKISSKPSLN